MELILCGWLDKFIHILIYIYKSAQRQTAATANFSSEQLRPFTFIGQASL